jgi:predicted phosphodiesterase
MVKSISKIFLLALSFAIVGFTMGCDFVDLLGLFASNELNERLLEKDNFIYLTEDERNMKDISFPSTGEFSFIVMTDTHVESGNTGDVEKIIGEITKHDAKFVAILGDITQNGAEKDFIPIKDFMRSLSVPCYPVLGNHDVYFNNWSEGWKKYIGSTRYKVSDGENVTLFILDSANAFFGKSQVDWLEKELKTAQGTVFVMTHSDLFVQDKIKIQQLYDPAERARVMSLLRNNDNCKMMLMGHSHERVEKEFGDVKYISIEDYKDQLIYCLVKVTKNGVSREFYKYDKNEFKKIK